MDTSPPPRAMFWYAASGLALVPALYWLLHERLFPDGEIDNCEDKVVVITGCDTGVGAGLAALAEAKGFLVVVNCLTSEGARAYTDKKRIKAVLGDMTTEDGIKSLTNAVNEEVGKDGKHLWAIVNNAGTLAPGNIEWLSPAAYKKVFDLNVFAPITLVYELLPTLKKAMAKYRLEKAAARPRVIQMSTAAAVISHPLYITYGSSKSALEFYSDALRIELLDWGLSVTNVRASIMRTPLMKAFADGWLQSFREAPEDRRAQYGDDWAEMMHGSLNWGIEVSSVDPTEMIAAIATLLVRNHPPRYLGLGSQFKYINFHAKIWPGTWLDYFSWKEFLLKPARGIVPLALRQG